MEALSTLPVTGTCKKGQIDLIGECKGDEEIFL